MGVLIFYILSVIYHQGMELWHCKDTFEEGIQQQLAEGSFSLLSK